MPPNGYISLTDLDRIPFLEEDVTVEGVGRFRVRALDQETIRQIAIRVRAESEGEGGYDYYLEQRYFVAFGLAQPDLGAGDNLDVALQQVAKLGRSPVVLRQLDEAVRGLTFRKPSEAFKDFFDGAGSPDGGAATANLPSASASSSTSSTPSS